MTTKDPEATVNQTTQTTLEVYKRAWYAAHVSHDPDYARDRESRRWHRTVLTARDWATVISRTTGNWQIAAVNRCLPWEL